MIAVLKHGTTEKQTQHLIDWLKRMQVDVHVSHGKEVTVLGLVGDTSRVDMELLGSLEIVESVKRVSEPYKQANRKFHPQDTVIRVGDAKIGGGHFAMIAGPCSVESEEQIISVAMDVKASGANILRGGAFKPRTSPYAFQGMKGEGIKLLLEAKKETGLPIVTEIMNISTLDLAKARFPWDWKEEPKGIRIQHKLFLEHGDRFDWPDLKAEDGGDAVFCHGLRDHFGILSDGTVVPCCLDREGAIALGNIFTQPMDEILQSPRAKAMTAGFSCRRATEELCRKCGYARRVS